MNRWKKVVLSVLTIILIAITGVCAYGIKMTNDANATVNDIYDSIDRNSSKRDTKVNIDAQEPFSVLLMGIDTGDLGRTEQGRSDTTMVVTINPKEKKSTMVSLDRDILTSIVGYGTDDKLNHAYAFGGANGGAKMAIDTVENLLDIPIDHYVSINMKGLKDLIDAVGGIEVNNTIGEFTLDGITVPAGKVKLDGETGLAYARMRKEDVEGDIGRQRRQREVVEKIINKVISFDGVSKYQKILNAVKDNVKTDLKWDDMIDIQAKYLSSFKNIESEQLQGSSASINEIYYQILDPESLYETQTKLRKQLGLEEDPNERDKCIAFYNQYSYSITDGQAQQYETSTNSYYDNQVADNYGTDQGTNYVEDPSNTTYYEDPQSQYAEQSNGY
jgi:LCP family protein required for cell wall assembly